MYIIINANQLNIIKNELYLRRFIIFITFFRKKCSSYYRENLIKHSL